MFTKSRIPIRGLLTEGLWPSGVRRRLYRRRGYRVAADVQFGPGVVIEADEVTIERGARIGIGTVIRGRRVHIGRRVEIGSFCFFEGRDLSFGDDTVVREQVFVGGPLFPDSELTIGKRVRVFQSCFLNPSRPLSLGDDTGLGGRSSIFTHGSWQAVTDGYPVAFEPVDIGRNVWLPWHVFILPGVTLGDNVTIGAGSVVNRSIPANSLAVGVPAKVVRPDAEWPPKLEEDQRWRIAEGILQAFAAYLVDNGVPARVESAGDRVDVRMSHEGGSRTVSLVAGGADVRPDDDIVVLLNGSGSTPPDGRQQWFDLTRKVKYRRDDPVSAEAQEFLARYGLRFVPHDEI